jgi:ParB family chromosome partitioning protein
MDRRLGKGLSSLLGQPADEGLGRALELGDIDPNPFQPRKTMDPGGLEELRDSIAQHGVLQPVVVRKNGSRYQLVSGERRWRAARLAGLERIPAVVRDDVTDEQMLELALVENLQRRDLDPIERARGFRALMETLGITQDEVAAKVGLKRATVANHLRLLELPAKVQEAVGKGLVTMGHARALLGLADAAQMEELLAECVRQDLSVRQTERWVREASAPAEERSGANARPSWIVQAESRLQAALATKAAIECDESFRGQVRLAFYTKQDLNRLLDQLAPRARLE